MNSKTAAKVLAAMFALGGAGAMAQAAEQQTGQTGQQMGQTGQHKGKTHQQMGQTGQQMTEPGKQIELTGRVLSVEEKTVWIEGEKGEAVPLRVTHETSLQGQHLKKDQRIESHLHRQFQPGEEVRASFQVQKERAGKYENRAVSIEKSTGGAGHQGTGGAEYPGTGGAGQQGQ